MGAVHGVYLKYVGLSALSYAGYHTLLGGDATGVPGGARYLPAGAGRGDDAAAVATWRLIGAGILGYSTVLNGAVAVAFKMARGMALIGKNPKTGEIPMWSYLVYFPFHLPTMLYTYIHMKGDKAKKGDKAVPVASEVQPGWWVGGRYSDELERQWAGIVDLTVEFPERCISSTSSYKLMAVWDGVPPTPAQLDDCATYAAAARSRGDVLVHCAHGRGRSTTVMCAALVKAGLFGTWEEAFERGIKPGRRVCKLNGQMRRALTEWQRDYVDGKKGS